MTQPSRPDVSITEAVTLGDEGRDEVLPSPPRAVGPYVLLERLGEGGMGVVYRAYDPRLDREVAIKLLRTLVGRSPGERARKRLVREARAMANVAHPNVVQVFDVGTVGEQVFVAMELVEGSTLGRWLRQEPRSTAEILDVFVQAGRGLRAAHDKGLVHRDFKPDNVLVGLDGRVRVTDFGLARAVAEGPASSPREPSEPSERGEPAEPSDAAEPAATSTSPSQTSARRLATRDDGLGALTRTGVVLGTPAYMALEQHLGAATEARTDQFAFCVALFEALAGQRPFAGATDLELGRAKQAMAVRELPARKGLRPAMRRAILRGLQADPARRWPGMGPLLDVLDPPTRASRWVLASLGAAGVLAAGLWLGGRDAGLDRCEAGEARVQRTWNDERAEALSRAFVATGVGYAEDTWSRVRARADDHVAQWRAAHRQACTAEPTATSDAVDRRLHCLDRRLARLEGLVATLEEPDAALVERAVELASSLHAPGECLDSGHDARDDPSPPTPELAEAWSRHADAAARVEVLLEAGRERQALALARTLVAEAEAADWPPLRANALLILGTSLEATDELDAADRTLAEAHALAQALGLDGLAARAAVQLVWLAGPRQLDEERAERWARHARTSMERQRSHATGEAGRGGEAWVEAALETALGATYLSLGRPQPAEAAYRRALALFDALDGEDAPQVARARANLGAALAAAGDYEGALAHEQAALEIWTRTLGEQHPERADAMANLAMAQARLGRYEDAIATQEQALVLRRRTFDPDDLSIANALNNLGAFEEARGNYERAERHHREAMALYEAALGDDDLRVAASQVNLGLTVLRRGRPDEARTLAQRAIATVERTAPEHPYLGHALVLLASAARAANDVEAAAAAAEGALTLCDAGVALEAAVCLEARYLLARALGPTPEERERARALAERIQAEMRDAPGLEPALLAELHAWLSELGLAPTPDASEP